MNKKLNTLLFILGATVVNLTLMVLLLVLMLVLVGTLVPEDSSPALVQMLLLFAFLIAIGGAFGIYTLLIKMVTKRVDMEKYFHPIFRPRNRKPF